MNIKYGQRDGLEGPIFYPNGRVIYFDPACDQYWDPTTDFYLSDDEITLLKQQLFDSLSNEYAQNALKFFK